MFVCVGCGFMPLSAMPSDVTKGHWIPRTGVQEVESHLVWCWELLWFWKAVCTFNW